MPAGSKDLLAMDHGYDKRGQRIMPHDIFAMDLATSVRHYDKDGQLHVSRTPISKAMICEYWGREIPGFQQLGLDANTKYRLLRDPEELKLGAASSNGKQLMFEHTPVNADDPKKESWIGSVGTDAEFDAPYLYNSIHVHDRLGIDGIESGEQKQLSSSYRYRADMTPGAFQGEAFDGVMRDIDFNHVTTCAAGRCGDDVFVHDSKPKESNMPKTVLSRKAAVLKGGVMAYLQPKLAMDAKGVIHAIDVTPVLASVTNGNFKSRKAQIVSGITACVNGKLAADAKLDDLSAFLGAFDEMEEPEAKAADEEMDEKDKEADKKEAAKDKKAKDSKAKDEDPKENFLKEKLSAADKKAYDAMCAKDEDEDEKDKKKAEDEEDDKEMSAAEKKEAAKDKKARDEAPEKKPDMAAMDSAIKKATTDTENRVVARFRSLRAAEEAVRPYLGTTVMAFDSADEAYKAALEANDVDLTGVPAVAFPAMLKLVPVPGAKREAILAMDAAPTDSFTKMFPDAARIGNA